MNTGLKIGLIVIFVGLVFLVIALFYSDKIKNDLEKYPVINTENELREALDKEPQKYIVYNAPLTGDPCEDPLGLMQDTYVTLQYRRYTYRVSLEKSDSWLLREETDYKSDKLMIYNDISLETDEYNPYGQILHLADSLKDEYTDNIYDTNYYYPNGYGDYDGNMRYEFWGIKSGTEVAFLALIGDGKVILSGLNENKLPSISGNNNSSSLEFSQDEKTGMFSAISLMLLFGGIIIVIISILWRLCRPLLKLFIH